MLRCHGKMKEMFKGKNPRPEEATGGRPVCPEVPRECFSGTSRNPRRRYSDISGSRGPFSPQTPRLALLFSPKCQEGLEISLFSPTLSVLLRLFYMSWLLHNSSEAQASSPKADRHFLSYTLWFLKRLSSMPWTVHACYL